MMAVEPRTPNWSQPQWCSTAPISALRSTVTPTGLLLSTARAVWLTVTTLLRSVQQTCRGRGQLANDTVVVTVMTNLGFRLAMDTAGINVVETGVGDRYVLEALVAGGHSLGGEQSGHVIFADHATTGDGLLTAVALIDIVKRSGSALADIASDAMTSLPQSLVNVRIADRVSDGRRASRR